MLTTGKSRAPLVVAAAVLLAGAVLTARPARAQSLAEVAKKEEERRKSVPEPTKVYTNKDLKAVPAGSPMAPPAETTPPAGDAAKGAGDAKAGKGKDGGDKEPVKDQAWWASKQKALHDQLSQDESYAEAMQTRINSLTADFVNRDDPVQRAKIERDRNKALADLERLKKASADDTKAIAAFEEDARRAGIPPGWLR